MLLHTSSLRFFLLWGCAAVWALASLLPGHAAGRPAAGLDAAGLPAASTPTRPGAYHPAAAGTPYPMPGEAISTANSGRVIQLAAWSRPGLTQVTEASFSPNGRLVASSSNNKTIDVWQTADGKLLYTLSLSDYVNSVSFSPDGRLLAAGCGDKTVRVYQAADGKPVKTLPGHTDLVVKVLFSPDGTTLASGSFDRSIKLWQTSDWKLRLSLYGHTDWIYTLAFSPDSAYLASASPDKSARIWRVKDGRQMLKLSEDPDEIHGFSAVAYSPDGALLATSTDGWLSGNNIQLRQAKDGRVVRQMHQRGVQEMSFSPDGSLLAAASDDKTVKLWKVADGSLLATLEAHTSWATSAVFSPDGRLLLTASLDGTLRMWGVGPADPQTGKALPTVPPTATIQPTLPPARPTPTGPTPTPTRTPVPTPSFPGLIFYTNIQNAGAEEAHSDLYSMDADGKKQTPLTSAAGSSQLGVLSPDRKKLAYWYTDPAARRTDLWLLDLEKKKAEALTTTGVGLIGPMSWAPDGQRLVFSSARDENSPRDLYILKLATKKLENLTQSERFSEGSPAWSPDGKWIAYHSDETKEGRGRAEIWLISPNGQKRKNLTNNGAAWSDVYPAWSPDGYRIAYFRWNDTAGWEALDGPGGGPGGLWVMNADGSQLKLLVAFDQPPSEPPLWSPDGKWIAASDSVFDYADIWVVSAKGGEPVNASLIPGHDRSPCWSPDSKALMFTHQEWEMRQLFIARRDGSEFYPIEMEGGGDYCAWRK